jgi:hypothetical protein
MIQGVFKQISEKEKSCRNKKHCVLMFRRRRERE